MRPLRRQSRIEEVPVPPRSSLQSELLGGDQIPSDQTEPKVVTKCAQSGNKVDTDHIEKWTQSGNKPDTIQTLKSKTGHKVDTQPDTISDTNWTQTSNKPDTNPTFSALVGLQRNMMLFFYSACKIARGRSTEPLTLEHISKSIKTSHGSVKTTIRRLEKKGHIRRIHFKNGRGGWSQYELLEATFREMLQLETENKLATNWTQSGNKPDTQPDTQPDTSTLSSSSKYINTTTEDGNSATSFFHLKIPDELKKIGFSENHLMQLKRDSKLPLESISSSLEALAYDLTFEDVKKKIRSPIGLIMKLLKASEPYLSEKGHEPEEDRLFRECIVRAEKHKIEKDKLKEKFLDLKFEQWLEPMADEELLKIVQPVGKLKGQFHLQQLKDHFKNEIFNGLNN